MSIVELTLSLSQRDAAAVIELFIRTADYYQESEDPDRRLQAELFRKLGTDLTLAARKASDTRAEALREAGVLYRGKKSP